MPIVKLSHNFIAHNLQCPEGKNRIEWCDSETRGLLIDVRATNQGVGTYFVRYKNHASRTSYVKLGHTSDISLAEARKQAKTLKAEIALGSDPSAEKKARKAIPTFSEFFEDHYLPYVKPRKRSWKRDEELYRLRIKKVFGHLRLNQISRQQVQLFHTDLRDEGLAPATCDHHIKLMKHVLNLAIDWEMLTEKNPVARVPLFAVDNKVERYLDEAELERLLDVLHTDQNRSVCLIAMFLMATGCRLNEALQATWGQIDKQNRVWRIPASNSKSKRVRSAPLNDSAMDILSQLNTEGSFEYLFVNLKTKRPYSTIMKVWTRLRNKAGLTLRLHDLRHFHASSLVCSGVPIYEVKSILGHANIVTTERYCHLNNKVLERASKSIDVILKSASKISSEVQPPATPETGS